METHPTIYRNLRTGNTQTRHLDPLPEATTHATTAGSSTAIPPQQEQTHGDITWMYNFEIEEIDEEMPDGTTTRGQDVDSTCDATPHDTLGEPAQALMMPHDTPPRDTSGQPTRLPLMLRWLRRKEDQTPTNTTSIPADDSLADTRTRTSTINEYLISRLRRVWVQSLLAWHMNSFFSCACEVVRSNR